MAEYASRGSSHASSYASSYASATSAQPVWAAPVRTPAEQANDEVIGCGRDVELARQSLDAVTGAHAANDPTRWHEARGNVDRQLVIAERSVERARLRASDATAETEQRFATAERTLADCKATAATFTEPPRAWKPISREAELLEILRAPIAGPSRAGFEHKEGALKAQFAQLTVGESNALASRLGKQDADDPIAAEFARMIPARRARAISFLGDARRRVAVDAAHRRKNATTAATATFSGPRRLPDQIRGDLEAATARSLGHVRVHADAHGNDVAEAHGARAVAVGHDIYMGEGQLDVASDAGRELLAHEVAHVVQADPGPEPQHTLDKRDENTREDAEADADRFATRFSTQGAGASWRPSSRVNAGTPMLAPVVARTAVEIVTTQVKATLKPDVAWAYLRANETNFVAAIAKRLSTVHPPVHEGLTWSPNGIALRFHDALYGALGADPLFAKLPELLHPVDPWFVIDQHRRLEEGAPGATIEGREPTGSLRWNPLAGEALAVEVVEHMQESLARMVPRLVVQLDAKRPAAVAVADLVTSHPFDRVTAQLLCDVQVVTAVAAKHGRASRNPDDPAQFHDGVRFLTDYRWLGASDPSLWNWIEVKDPHDATVEEVAATLWLDPNASQRAYGITASPPFFRVDPSWARMFDDAKRHAPSGADPLHADNALALASSTLATDAAITQAAGERKFDKRGIPLPADREQLITLLDRSQRQLDRLKEQLAPWKLWELTLPAIHWVAANREHLFSIPDHVVIGLAPAIEGQQEILYEAVAAVGEIANASAGAAAASGAEGAMTSTLRHYATAIGESHLLQAARPELVRARAARGVLALALLEESGQDTQGAINNLQADGGMGWSGDQAATMLANERHEIVELRTKQATGQAVDPDDVDLLSANLKEQAVEARAKSWYLSLSNLQNEARDSKFGFFETIASVASTDVRGLPSLLGSLIAELQVVVLKRHRELKEDKLRESGAQDKKARAWALRVATRTTEANLAAFVKDHKLVEMFQPWIYLVQSQVTRTSVLKIASRIALLIGTSMVGGFAGAMASSAVRGALLADAADATIGMLWATRVANATGAIAGLATDATVNATVQTAIGDGSFADTFVDNFVSNGALRVALAPIHKVAEAFGGVEKDVRNLGLWERSAARGASVLRAGVTLTADMITGAAVEYVVHRVRYGEKPDEKTAMEWALNGASMAIGSFVGKWIHGFEARLGGLLEHGAQLKRRASRMRDLARHVEQTGDKDGAMELLVERHQALDEEASSIHELLAKGKITAQTANTLEVGNRAELGAVKDNSFATMPLRLAGLTPDDASGKIWAGATEDIAIALDQAHRSGLAVDVISHDIAARRWKIRYNGDELTIVETGLEGQPRAAKATPTDADRMHAIRYARSAEFLQERWEANLKAEIDTKDVIEVDHLQLGYAYAGVVNQATLPATGEALDNKLVVYGHKGALSGRGPQELGQGPEKFDAPGVRATEQAKKGAALITSADLDRSLDVGRLETQTRAYRGQAIELEARPKGLQSPTIGEDAWKAPSRAFRVKIRDGVGGERWFYCDRLDNVGGLGPARLDSFAGVTEPAVLDAMLENQQVLRGDDPDYAQKVKAGRVLVWGGSPTGAWAAEPVVTPESSVTVLGDTKTPSDWPSLLREYEDINHEIATHPSEQVPADLAARKAQIERLIARAHSGMTIRRNTKPGATYDKPVTGRGPHDVQIEFGTPSKIAPVEDGRVMVTIGTGEDARSSVYDQVVIAHGQDPGAVGAPGGLLGPTTKGATDDVPAGTIALRPIYGPAHGGREPEILGLESIDPPGIQLKGAAYANKRMSPWVEKSERARFVRSVDEMSAEHAPTRDFGEISEDSRGVSSGMEVQRDRIPRANEVLGAKAYRLPGPDHTLELDPDHREKWDDEVREFFTINLRANAKWVRVQRLGGGRSGAVVYQVWVDENDVGVFKLFDHQGAAREQEMLKLLRDAHLKHVTPVRERGQVAVDPKSGFDGALLMDVAKGTTVKELIETLPTEPSQRTAALRELRAAAERVGLGLAEMHAKLESGGMMTTAAKLNDAKYFLDNNFREGRDVGKVRYALGEIDFERIKAQLEGTVLDAFIAANVPATAYHGDANAGNFVVNDYNQRSGFTDLGMIDVGSMSYSVTDQKGTRTGAADVARFLGSLESLAPGAMNAGEIEEVRASFRDAYFREYAKYRQLDRTSYAAAEKWYRIEMEVAVLKADSRAKGRILDLLETRP